MSSNAQILTIVLLIVPLWIQFKRDYVRGLCFAVTLMICMTHYLRIQTPGALPELTIQRVVLLVCLKFWWGRRAEWRPIREVPMYKEIRFWLIVSLLSFIGTVDYVFSLKRLLDFVFEIFLFYFLISTSILNRAQAFQVLRAACLGIAIVGFLAVLERQTGINLVDRYFPNADDDMGYSRDIRVTYQHRILLGTAMAMGWPLAFALLDDPTRKGFRRVTLWLSVVFTLAGCYFAMSRGPWLASALAGMCIFAFGTAALRKRAMLLCAAAVVGVLTHPGVIDTLTGFAKATADRDSLKGGSFLYRFELWRIAYEGIAHSPWRLLLGNGPGAGGAKTVDWVLTYRDKNYTIDSWDNEFAYTLYQTGFLGLAATLGLFGGVAYNLFKCSRRVSGGDRGLLVGIFASAIALIFMMTNVHIFARQLYYILWILAASGFTIASHQLEDSEPVTPTMDRGADEDSQEPSFDSNSSYS